MITVLVTYKLPEAMNRVAAHALAEQVAPRFQVLEGLRMKHFLYQEERGLGGGFYTWDSREAADTFHTEMWLDSMEERMGSRPELQYFETAVVVDNNSGEVWVEAA